MREINTIQVAAIFRAPSPSTSRPLTLMATLMLTWLTLAVPVQAAALKEDDLLLLDFKLGQQTLASSVTSYALGDTAMVSLAEFGAALDFPIDVDPVAGTATGSFIKPTRSFKLDIKAGFVEIEGKRTPLVGDEVVVHHGAIFATMAALSRWFPVDLRLQSAALSIEVAPRERLPVQEREDRRRGAQQIYSIGPASLPLIDTPYKLLGPPAADIGLGYSITRSNGGTPRTGLNYSALVGGDVAYMDSKLYLNGDRNDSLTDARLTLSRDKLGLPLGLRYTEIGDIVPAITSGSGSSGMERGILLQGGGSAIGRDDLINSDSINVSGNALPGWDVELFQNGMRVGYQSIGSEGRYNFTNLDPFAGENKLELVFYGPAGERRSETVVRNSGLGPDQPGSVRYQFSASQKGRPLYQGNNTANLAMSDIGSARLAAGMEVRVLPQLSLRGSWSNVMENGQRLNYASLGASTEWRDITLNADATRDPLRGTTWSGSLQFPATTNIWGFDTRFSHTQYAQAVYVDTTQSPQSSPSAQTTPSTPTSQTLQITSRTGLTLNRRFEQTGVLFSLNHNREIMRNSSSASLGFTTRFDKLTVGNTLNYYRFGTDPNGVRDPNRMTGNAFLSMGGQPMTLRGGVSYTLKPYKKAEQYYADSDLRVAQDMSINFGLTYTPFNRFTSYTSGLNWQLPSVTLSPRITYNSDKTYSGFIYASFSLAPRPDRGGVLFSGQPLATAGIIAARVFADNDGSSSFTPGDAPLPNVTVRAPQAFRTAITDEQGVAYVTGIYSSRATDVVLAEDTLPTPQMSSKNAGNSVRPRPNATVVIDFPVIPTGEIDGHVYSMQLGNRAPLGGVMVELRNPQDKVIAFKISAADGYFVFESTPYGSYTLNLAGDRRERANQPKVTLSRDHGSQLNTNMILAAQMVETPAAPSIESRLIAPVAAPKVEALSDKPLHAKTPAIKTVPAPVPKQATEQALPVAPKISDGRLVQVGAFSNVGAAKVHRLKMLELGLMRPEQVRIVSIDLGPRGIFHRVVATPINETADELCRSLKKRGADCFPIDPWF
jgi:cell division septation protein DedD